MAPALTRQDGDEIGSFCPMAAVLGPENPPQLGVRLWRTNPRSGKLPFEGCVVMRCKQRSVALPAEPEGTGEEAT